MKKILMVILTVLIAVFNIHICAQNGITLYLDDNEITCNPAPLIINSRTMIPARAVFEELGAEVSWQEEKRTVGVKYENINIEMKIDSDVATVNGMGVRLDSPAVIVDSRTMIPLRFIGEAIGATVLWEDKTRSVYITSPESVPPAIIENVAFKKGGEYDCLSMTSSGKTSVRTMILKEPTRMVFDIQNASLAVKNSNFEGKAIEKVRYGNHENYVRIVAENKNLPRYIFTDVNGYTELKLYSEKKNFDYSGLSEYKFVFSDGVNVKYVSESGNVLVFETDKTLESETVEIGDVLIDSVTVSGKKVAVKLLKNAEFTVNGNILIFNVKEETKKENVNNSGIIVLDAGHGGRDPGTLGYDESGKIIIANEKDMNLAITLIVYEMLMAQNVKVILTRSEDIYLELKERSDIANKYNAEFFVSIHNNSIPNPDYKGSMVLYSLNSPGGKKLADNILREMTKSAKTENKGLRDGTNMYVIRNTAMPAVIVECGCLTNAEELENLMDIDFLYRLAEGIAEGILITLES